MSPTDNSLEPCQRGLATANRSRGERFAVKRLINTFSDGLTSKRRGRSPVRRRSELAGKNEEKIWRDQNIFSRIEKDTRLAQIGIWADEHRVKGRAWGLLTPKQKDILRVLHNARCYVTGRLDRAWSTICQMTPCCNQTLSEALIRFEQLGLAERMRRIVPIDDPEPGGPKFTTITNAYFLKLPGEVAKRVRAALAKITKTVLPPVPPPREPTEQEKLALAKAMTPAAGESREEAARRGYYGKSAIRSLNARRNAGAFGPAGDST